MGLGGVEVRRRRLSGWLALVLALTALGYGARLSEGKPPKDVLYRWDNALGGAIEFAIILGLVLLIARGDRALFALRRPRNAGGAVGGALLVLLSVYVLTGLLSPILDPAREQGLTPDHWDSSRATPFIANALVICVVAPLVEEITFRGVGFSLIVARFGVEPAIVATAVFWGLAHGLFEALPLLVGFGIGLAWLRERQGSIVPGMILHALFNILALVYSLTT